MTFELLKYETLAWEQGKDKIVGIDEVGRGSLAGPLVVGAVVLNKNHIEQVLAEYLSRNNDVVEENVGKSQKVEEFDLYATIKDSKLLSAKKREILSEFIKTNSVKWAVAEIEPYNIDKWGIAEATQQAFLSAVKNLEIKVDHVFTDTFPIKRLKKKQQTNIVSGDKFSMSIAAASIVAKVYRDALMVDFHDKYPKYGFDRHKGYGTKLHKECIATHGPCEIHRFSFEPMKSMK